MAPTVEAIRAGLCRLSRRRELRLYGVLRSWLRGSAGGIMLVVKGEIPLGPKRKPTVVDLIGERSPDQSSSNDSKSFWRIVPDHLYHLDPRLLFLRPRARRSPLHRRCRRRHQSVL